MTAPSGEGAGEALSPARVTRAPATPPTPARPSCGTSRRHTHPALRAAMNRITRIVTRSRRSGRVFPLAAVESGDQFDHRVKRGLQRLGVALDLGEQQAALQGG